MNSFCRCVLIVFTALAVLLNVGCSWSSGGRARSQGALGRVREDLLEESRALTTGALDLLAQGLDAETNSPPELAKRLLQRNQEIMGAPQRRIDVEALVAQDAAAWDEYRLRMDRQRHLLEERARLARELREKEDKLIELGTKYEEERRRSILKRVWHWAIGTFGLGGLIAVCVLCPAVLPLFGRLAAYLVARIPSLASFLGVVGKQAFDGLVSGVSEVRAAFKAQAAAQQSVPASEALAVVNSNLAEAEAQHGHGTLVEYVRSKLGV